jgi:hypothetical protein
MSTAIECYRDIEKYKEGAKDRNENGSISIGSPAADKIDIFAGMTALRQGGRKGMNNEFLVPWWANGIDLQRDSLSHQFDRVAGAACAAVNG